MIKLTVSDLSADVAPTISEFPFIQEAWEAMHDAVDDLEANGYSIIENYEHGNLRGFVMRLGRSFKRVELEKEK